MRSERDIERAFRQANLDVDIDGQGDRQVLDALVEAHDRSRASHAATRSNGHRWTLGLAAIVVLIVGIALLVGRSERTRPERPGAEPRAVSRIELARAVSLEKAFRQGGIEAVEKQYQRAFGDSRTRGEGPSIAELLAQLEAKTFKDQDL